PQPIILDAARGLVVFSTIFVHTVLSSNEHNISIPNTNKSVLFNHVYNIHVPASALCTVDLDASKSTKKHRMNAAASAGQAITEHTINGENQIVFTHRIHIPRQACGCAEDLPVLKDLLKRLEMLEGQVSALKQQCSVGSPCCNTQAAGDVETKPYCNGHGNFSAEMCQCVCEPGWKGPNCTQSECPQNCRDKGRCVQGSCECYAGFSGQDCSQLSCPNSCNHRGSCIDGQCICEEGFTGEDCSQRACPNDCMKRGYCLDGTCICQEGYFGDDCSGLVCPDNCNERGRCVNGKCSCVSGYEGESCATISCLNNCHNNGQCVDGQCLCEEGYMGQDCFDVSPPKDLTVGNVTQETVDLSWSNDMLVTEYLVTSTSSGGLYQQFTVPGDQTSATVKELEPGIEYLINVYAVLSSKKSVPVTLDPPTSFEKMDGTETSLTLTWQKPQAKVTGYKLGYVSEDGQFEEFDLPGTADTFVVPNLTAGTTYTFTLTAERGQKKTEAEPEVEQPGHLNAVNVTDVSATLLWQPSVAKVDGYVITYRSDTAPPVVEHVTGDTVQFEMASLAPATHYTVTLQAVKEALKSDSAVTEFTTAGQRYRYPKDCAQIFLSGETDSGLYTIYVAGEESQPLQVYCDMTTDGGGWMVFLRRQNGKLEFFRNWKNYTAGFGNMNNEFWLGLSNLYKITSSGHYELRVDLRDKGESAYAQYDKFTIAEPRTRYKIYIGAYSGTAGDSMTYHQGRPFSTFDNDNDVAVTNCALSYKGAFWYKNCHRVNLMGKYGDSTHSKGINWFHWRGHEHSIEFAEMKIRPADFRNGENGKKLN
uniref:Zmp:0000000846 n=1 Tax=Periophthalmus magnuspinnatus TaxID=409849 RepID=A0A3B4AV78_9GOBI